jgi:beta-glucuronidase
MKPIFFFGSVLFILMGTKGYPQQFSLANAKDIALFPQQNDIRNTFDLSGIWKYKKDSLGSGEKDHWFNGLKDYRSIAVPGRWNEQFDDMRDYLDLAWYEKATYIPGSWKGQRIFNRVGSANYAANIWINGVPLGHHEGGHLPFAFEITSLVKWNSNNRITIQIENILKPSRVPAGGPTASSLMNSYPKAHFDFFPYAGLNRAVWLYTIHAAESIQDVIIKTSFTSTDGTVELKVNHTGKSAPGKVVISGSGQNSEATLPFSNGAGTVAVRIPNVRLWSPEDPFLYTATVILGSENKILDPYTIETGVRTRIDCGLYRYEYHFIQHFTKRYIDSFAGNI